MIFYRYVLGLPPICKVRNSNTFSFICTNGFITFVTDLYNELMNVTFYFQLISWYWCWNVVIFNRWSWKNSNTVMPVGRVGPFLGRSSACTVNFSGVIGVHTPILACTSYTFFLIRIWLISCEPWLFLNSSSIIQIFNRPPP